MPSYANQTTRLQKQSLPVFPTQTSFTQLFGDTFATNPANSLYLLEDVTSAIAGTSLTNSVSPVIFDQVTDLTIKPINVGTFNGVDNYLSLPTEGSVEVGSGSFVASIWFKIDGLPGDTASPFLYGDRDSQRWQFDLGSTGQITFFISDGANSGAFGVANQNQLFDNRWHNAVGVVDRERQLMSLYVDGVKQVTTGGNSDVDISSVGSLNNVGSELLIGANQNGGVKDRFMVGQLANFSLYFPDTTGVLPPDYNLPALSHAGIRESANIGGFNLTNNSNNRINNRYDPVTGTVSGDYSTCVINTSEGIYDILSLDNGNANEGIEKILIDGEIVAEFDHYESGLTRNIQHKQEGIYLTGGTHILKILSDTKNDLATLYLISKQMLELIKRDGNNEGDDESSSGLLLADELLQRTNATVTQAIKTNRAYNTRTILSDQDQGFFEGDLFLKKGLYTFTYSYEASLSAGLTDIFFGGVKVFDGIDEAIGSGNVFVSRSAFIEGGKTTVKVLQNGLGIGSTNSIRFVSLRYELVTGKSNGDEVNIWGADTDGQELAGNWGLTILDTNRFNYHFANADANLNDKITYTRYFSGGTYAVDYIYRKSSIGGVVDVTVNGVVVINVNQNGSGSNAKAFGTITIPRGFQDVSFEVVADGNPTELDYLCSTNRLLFTKIADIESDEDNNSDPVHGALVPLAQYKAVKSEGSVTFDLGGVDLENKYSNVNIKFAGQIDGLLDLEMLFNELVDGYREDIFSQNDTTIVGSAGSVSITEITLVSSAFADVNTRVLVCDINIQTDHEQDKIIWDSKNTAKGAGHIFNSGQNITATDTSLNQLILQAVGSTWKSGTTITIYGVLK